MSTNTESGYIPSYEDILEAQKITFYDVMQHTTGPVISLVVHILLFTFLGSIVIFPGIKEEKEDFLVENVVVNIQKLDKVKEIPKIEKQIEIPTAKIDEPDPELSSDPELKDIDLEENEEDNFLEKEMIANPFLLNDSSLTLSGIFVNRESIQSKKAAIKKYSSRTTGRGPSNKYPPARAIDILKSGIISNNWFVNNQNDDGSWGEIYKPGNTSLVLLALLAQGYTPLHDEYGLSILKGIKYLCASVEDIPTFCTIDKKKTGLGQPEYQSAMVGYALSEAYALTKTPQIKRAMNKQIEYLISKMLKNGGYARKYNNRWRTIISRTDEEIKTAQIKSDQRKAARLAKGTKKKRNKQVGMGRSMGYGGKVPRNYWKADPNGEYMPANVDLSISAWHYQALKTAYAAGCDVEGLKETLEKSIGFVKSNQYKNLGKSKDKEESWGWSTWNNSASNQEYANRLKGYKYPMLNAGLLTLYLMGEGKSSDAKNALRELVDYDEGYYLNCDWSKIENDINEYEKFYDKKEVALNDWIKKKEIADKAGNKNKKKISRPKKIEYKGKIGENLLKERYENGAFSLYTWYYQTMVLFQAYNGPGGNGGGAWEIWNANFTNALVKNQQSDGSWLSPAHNSISAYGESSKIRTSVTGQKQIALFAASEASDSRDASIDLKVYSTAMCSLMMSVYYRYQPSISLEADRGRGIRNNNNSAENLLEGLL